MNRMSRLLFAITLLLIVSSAAFAQKEYNQWFFGSGYGLNFNSNSPADTIPQRSFYFFEGNATISNPSTGALLFYTDGVRVFDNQHAQMPNGSGLKGSYSSAQSALIVPMPGNSSKYYIFTADQEGYIAPSSGAHYSIVDMSQNSGRGDVTTKNVQIHTTCAEHLTAVKHPNGRDYWVLTHGYRTNYFYARLVSPSGVSTTPIVSQVGSSNYPTGPLSLGYLKASPNGRKLALTLYNGLVELYDFDPCTGRVSNPLTLKPFGTGSAWAYSSSFSPNSSKLYFSYSGAIWQYDVSLSTSTAILNSGTTISDPNNTSFVCRDGCLQLGPDGKIYVRGSNTNTWLGTISSPNNSASNCGFDVDTYIFPAGTNNLWVGLPNNIDARSTSALDTIEITGDTVLCEGESSSLSAPSGTFTYRWSTGATSRSITVSTAGTYWVNVTDTVGCGSGTDTVQVVVNPKPRPVISPNGTSRICQGDSITFTVTQSYPSYRWSNGATTRSLTVRQAGTYRVTVTDANGCVGDTAVTVVVNPNPVPVISGNLNLCQGDSTTLTVQSGMARYRWSTGDTTRSIKVGRSGTYSVTVTDVNGCSGSASKTVVVNPLPQPKISGNLEFCMGGSTVLSGDSGYVNYWWSTGDTTRSITVNTSGTYTLTVKNSNGCIASVSVKVTTFIVEPPVISGDTMFCVGGSTFLSVDTKYKSFNWSTGETTSRITVNHAGNYSVTVIDSNGCISTSSIDVGMYPQPTPEITGNTSFCQGGKAVLTASPGYSSYYWSTGEKNQSITVNYGGVFSVTVIDSNGCTGTAMITVVANSPLVPKITGNTTICSGESTKLTTQAGYASYRWSTGDTTQSITVSNAGTYSVTVTDGNGCSGTSSITVKVNPLPTPAISGNLGFCQGSSTVLDAGDGYVSYRWSTGETTQTIVVNSADTFTVEVTNNAGCRGTSARVVTEVYPIPDARIVAQGPTTFCPGEKVVLTAEPAGANYRWSTGEMTQSITVRDSGIYTVIVTSGYGCRDSAAIPVKIRSKLEPTISFNGNPLLCDGEKVEIVAEAGYASYLWSNGEKTPSITVSTPGQYWVEVKSAGGCEGVSDTLTVTAHPKPAVDIESLGSTELCTGSSLGLRASNGFISYIWSTGQTSRVIGVNAPGLYWVKVTDANGCTAADTISISMLPRPVVDAGVDRTICPGDSAQLKATGGISYKWAPTTGLSCSDCDAPMASPSATTQYIVTVTDAKGCSATDTAMVYVNTVPVVVRAHIDNYFVLEPGKTAFMPVYLDDRIENEHDAARIRSFDFSLKYDSTVLKLENGGMPSMLWGTVCTNWRVDVIKNQPGNFVTRLYAPDNICLRDTGLLLNLEFSGFVGRVPESALKFNVSLPEARCTEVVSTPGKARIETCGLDFRLIEMTDYGFALKQNRPNPFNPSTIIDFSLPLDGYALLQIFDASGREVTRLVDGDMKAGEYSVSFDATRLPAGVYGYRLISSGMMRMHHMTVVK